MGAEQKYPPTVNPREFLDKPFTKLEVGKLQAPPDIDLLRYLLTLENETGLVHQTPEWFVVKASKDGIPGWAYA